MKKDDSILRSIWKRLRKKPLSLMGLGLIGAYAGVAIFAPLLAPPPPNTRDVYLIPQDGYSPDPRPPSREHLFGTTEQQYDLYYGIIWGTRSAFKVGMLVVLVSLAVGILVGGFSGYYGGWIDEVMMRIVDTIFAFPGLILALIIVAVLGGGYWQLVLAFTLFGWASYGRLIRGEVLSIKENEYVLAAKALGAKDRSVIFKHIIPNAMPPLLVVASLNIGTVVIGVAALGFLGLGMPPGTAEWGTMLDETRTTLIQGPEGSIPWWATVFPGLAIFVFVMSMNLIGDGINDALDAQEIGAGEAGGAGGDA
ncbi:MAG: ABC transporter permease [Euryarchaeota archaeon]|nr:ABC transporter permease [Euryarchaeota archaeon]